MKTRDGVVNSHKKKTTIMCTRKKGNKPDPAGFSRLVWPLLVIALAIGNLFAGATAASAAGPGICQNDQTFSCSTNADCTAHSGGVCYLPTAGGQTVSHTACL